MDNWKQPPLDPEIANYIDCYWFLKKSPSDISHASPKLNPSPEAHLILTPADQPYHYTVGETDKQGYGSHLILPNTQTVNLHHTNPFVIIGIKFKVGALYSLAHPVNLPLLDDVIDGSVFLEILDLSLPVIPTKVTRPDAIDQLRMELDNWLRPLLEKTYNDYYSQLTQQAVALLENIEIGELSQQLHCARRTIERAFRQVTGLTLKQYCTMRTLDLMLYYLYQNKDNPPDWADVATKFDFSDQPHLIRYLKTAIGATPGNYLKQRDLTIDVYGDFE